MEINDQSQLPPIIANLMYAASVCSAQGKTNDAILLYDKIIDMIPDYANAYYERGRAKHQAGDVQGATEDLKKAFQLSPEMEQNITGQFQAGSTKCK